MSRDFRRALKNNTVIGRFVSAGIAGAMLENAALFVFVQFLGLGTVVAAVVAKELAILTVFSINDNWTFAEVSGTDDTLLVRLAKSHAVRIVGVGAALGVLYVLVTYTGLWYIIANGIGIGVGFVVNYTLESIFTWETHQHEQR